MAIYRLGIVCLLSHITQWLHVAIYRLGIVCLLSHITQWLHVAIYRLGIVCLLSHITQWLHVAIYRSVKYSFFCLNPCVSTLYILQVRKHAPVYTTHEACVGLTSATLAQHLNQLAIGQCVVFTLNLGIYDEQYFTLTSFF